MEVKYSLLVLALCVGLHHVLGNDYTLTTITAEPEATGAMCLDGTPPGYYMRDGSGDNANKWVLHLMGGGWCFSTEECYQRSLTSFGSTSVDWPQTSPFDGILSSNKEVNPDFYNWNGVFLIYCDGGSFAGNRGDPDQVNTTNSTTNIYYRGYRNLQAIIRHLNEERGMSDATDVILTGCSAGGLATFLHADFVGTLITDGAKYRALPDAGYFININELIGATLYTNTILGLLQLQNIDEAIIPACSAENSGAELWRCFDAPSVYNYITTPVFVVNPLYDSTVIDGFLKETCPPSRCPPETLLEDYRTVFSQQIQPVLSSSSENGYFLDSCYVHCQTIGDDQLWGEIAVEGRTIAQSFGDWYFERSTDTRLKDCDTDSPCNPTCPGYDGAVKNIVSPFLLLLSLYTIAALVY